MKQGLKPFKPSSIVNISSIGGTLGFPNNPGYCASKGGIGPYQSIGYRFH